MIRSVRFWFCFSRTETRLAKRKEDHVGVGVVFGFVSFPFFVFLGGWEGRGGEN